METTRVTTQRKPEGKNTVSTLLLNFVVVQEIAACIFLFCVPTSVCCPHSAKIELEDLRVGRIFDVRDDWGKWLRAKVISVAGSRVQVSFHQWASKWNVHLDMALDLHRIALPFSYVLPDLDEYYSMKEFLMHHDVQIWNDESQWWQRGTIECMDKLQVCVRANHPPLYWWPLHCIYWTDITQMMPLTLSTVFQSWLQSRCT